MLDAVKFLAEHYVELAAGLMAVLSGVITIALVIPGDQPEKSLQKVVDLLAKVSKK